MRETAFLKQNEQKWREFETILRAPRSQQNPDQLADLFLELTDDLSYARTHFPESPAVKYLNSLTATVHQAIYRNKRQKASRFLNFWTYEVPLTLSQSFRSLLIAFTVFLLGAIVGWFSTGEDKSFLATIVGTEYVNMTEQNIAERKPMAVYGGQGQVDSFLGITFNNIKVSFLAFVAGILFSTGTILMLFYNGIMLGAFHGFLHQAGYLFDSIQAVYMHGTLEITAIIVAGAAGFELGNSILFPGTFTRLQSLRAGAIKGLKIICGLIPVFIVAGFIEGFLTRYSQTAPVLAWAIIILSMVFVIYYFIILPLTLINTELNAEKR